MNQAVYDHSLGIALVLMLFFAVYFLVGKTPDKPIFANYVRSRRIMGVALLVLSANYSVHLFCGLRPLHPREAILMNLSTYFLVYGLFSSALIVLLDRFYLTRRRFLRHISYWALFTASSALLLNALPPGPVQQVGLILMALWLVGYGIRLSRKLIRTYRRAVRLHQGYLQGLVPRMDCGASYRIRQADADAASRVDRSGRFGESGIPFAELFHQDFCRKGRMPSLQVEKDFLRPGVMPQKGLRRYALRRFPYPRPVHGRRAIVRYGQQRPIMRELFIPVEIRESVYPVGTGIFLVYTILMRMLWDTPCLHEEKVLSLYR